MAGGGAGDGVSQLTSTFMTDHEALIQERLSTSWDHGDETVAADYVDADYGHDEWDGYPDEYWAGYTAEPPTPPGPAWFHNPRLLFGLIGVAAAALVVASVLLITGKDSGEIPTARHLSTRTAPATPSERSTPPPAEPPSSTASSSPSAETSSPVPEDAPLPEESQQPAESAAPPPPAPETGLNKSGAGPKINVTRTPMSFTPGKH